MRLISKLGGFAIAVLVVLLRLTCRYRILNDPRPALRAAGSPYVYALLHAHQISAVLVNDEDDLVAMVSRSADGDLLVPSLTVRGVRAVRGSTRKAGMKEKHGQAALQGLCDYVQRGIPGLLAVDGPRGPRNHVHRGISEVARRTHATVLPCVVVPARRWIFSKAWDRLQIPKPFTCVSLIFAPSITHDADNDEARLRSRVREALTRLEQEFDPREAVRALAAG